MFKLLTNISIYRAAGRGDCSNGGASSFYDSVQFVYLEGEQVERLDMVRNREAILNDILATEGLDPIAEKVFVCLQLTQERGAHYYAVPLSLLLEGRQSMAGGNLLSCSDSRFRNITEAMRIHDRVEG